MVDLLNSALAFQDLLDIKYKIIVVRKNKETKFTIEFKKEHFHHLIGLQKLDDIDFSTQNRSKIFDLILEEQITYDFLSKSKKFKSDTEKNYLGVQERISYFNNIVNIMDSDNLVFKFNRSKYNWSKIRCKFIIENKYYDRPVYVFIDELDRNKDEMFCRSFFPKNISNYTSGSIKMSLLYKEKTNKKTGESIIQVNKLRNDKTI